MTLIVIKITLLRIKSLMNHQLNSQTLLIIVATIKHHQK